jgi:hypothetical protein
MAWTIVTRDDYFEGSESMFISLSHSHFGFNANFVRQAELDPELRVTVYVNSDARKLGFEFHKEDKANSFSLSSASSAKKGEKRKGIQCASRGIVRKYSWIESVTKLTAKNRRFNPKKEGKKWVIQLCPAFETRKARESDDIPSEARGIYRYVREDGKIVYIGRGDIRSRLKSPEREDWDFDTIEYSLIENPDEQVRWEDYWIEKYKGDNGDLPFYNSVSGASKYREFAA